MMNLFTYFAWTLIYLFCSLLVTFFFRVWQHKMPASVFITYWVTGAYTLRVNKQTNNTDMLGSGVFVVESCLFICATIFFAAILFHFKCFRFGENVWTLFYYVCGLLKSVSLLSQLLFLLLNNSRLFLPVIFFVFVCFCFYTFVLIFIKGLLVQTTLLIKFVFLFAFILKQKITFTRAGYKTVQKLNLRLLENWCLNLLKGWLVFQ